MYYITFFEFWQEEFSENQADRIYYDDNGEKYRQGKLIYLIFSESFDLKELPYMRFLSQDNRNIRYVIEDTGVVVGYFAFVSSLILYVIDNLILAIQLKLSENDIVIMSACLSNLLNKLYLGIDVFHNIPAVCLRNLLHLLVNIHDEAVLNKVAKESKRKLAGSGGTKKAHNIKAKRKTVYEYIDITEKDLNGNSIIIQKGKNSIGCSYKRGTIN